MHNNNVALCLTRKNPVRSQKRFSAKKSPKVEELVLPYIEADMTPEWKRAKGHGTEEQGHVYGSTLLELLKEGIKVLSKEPAKVTKLNSDTIANICCE
jgi:hypothetical protein